jgi:hypothetical protein
MTANDQTARFLDTLADSIDPVRFAARLGIVCDPWQVQALRSKEKRILFCVDARPERPQSVRSVAFGRHCMNLTP